MKDVDGPPMKDDARSGEWESPHAENELLVGMALRSMVEKR
jgi:hypothetical protein